MYVSAIKFWSLLSLTHFRVRKRFKLAIFNFFQSLQLIHSSVDYSLRCNQWRCARSWISHDIHYVSTSSTNCCMFHRFLTEYSLCYVFIEHADFQANFKDACDFREPFTIFSTRTMQWTEIEESLRTKDSRNGNICQFFTVRRRKHHAIILELDGGTEWVQKIQKLVEPFHDA